ncbi:MAG TPA: hypothetical protein PLX41_10745 [Bacteroidales bacterium]|jgi:hypothetical protein|nr:hypothetical protein [Bacteroidales bacterium]
MMAKSKNFLLTAILIVIGVGIWVLVLQNVGIIPIHQKVEITNTVGVDIEAINGDYNVFYVKNDGSGYYALPVIMK